MLDRSSKIAASRSSPHGRKKVQNFLPCVTTRRWSLGRHRRQNGRQRPSPGNDIPHADGPCVPVPQQLADDESPAARDAAVGIWRLATGEPLSGILIPGSTAASIVAAGSCARSPFAGRYGNQAGDYSPKNELTGYPGIVPREVFAPDGAARETRQSLSGTSLIWPSPVDGARPHFNGPYLKKTVPPSMTTFRAGGARKETEKETRQINLSLRRTRK